MSTQSGPRSLVWGYFKKLEKYAGAECIRCKKHVSAKGNTSNLLSHLRNHHPIQFNELKKVKHLQEREKDDYLSEPDMLTDTMSPSTLSPEVQQSLHEDSSQDHEDYHEILSHSESSEPELLFPTPSTSTFTSNLATKKVIQTSLKDYRRIDANTQDKITNAVAYFIAIDMLPYSTVEKNGFKNLLKICVPSYNIPSRKTITERKIPDLYNKTKLIIENSLRQANCVAYTTDCWTSSAGDPYLALTAHFITQDWNINSFCLNCTLITEDHTAENISSYLLHLQNEWNLSDKTTIAFTTDWGSNILKAVNDYLKYNHVACFGHTMNTAISKALDIALLEPIIIKLKKIQSLFHHSWKIQRDLKNLQERFDLPIKKIPTYSKTRWWSLLRLMKVVVEQNIALFTLLSEYSNGCYACNILNQDELKVLKSTISFLDPLQQISEHMSGEHYITASAILPIFKQIDILLDIDTLNNEENLHISTIQKELKAVLEKRYFLRHGTNLLLQKCSFLDPRFKNIFKEDEKNAVRLELKQELLSTCLVYESEKVTPKKQTGLAAIFKTQVQHEEDRNGDEICDKELTKYAQILEIPVEEDPLCWWKIHQTNFPNLSNLGKKYLSIPATSVPSERVFSRGGKVVTDTRCSLVGEHVEQLVFLAQNEKYVPKS